MFTAFDTSCTFSRAWQLWPDFLRLPHSAVSTLTSLSNHDGDSNENVKKEQALVSENKQNNSARALYILVRFFSIRCKTTT